MEQALGLLRQALQIDPSYARGMAIYAQLLLAIHWSVAVGHRDDALVADTRGGSKRRSRSTRRSAGYRAAALRAGLPGDERPLSSA